MAAQTFGDVWRRVQLLVSAAPPSLAQLWVQQTYDDLLARRHWGWLKTFTTLTPAASLITMPADFRSISTLTDPATNRPVVWWLTSEQLEFYDPGRLASGGPIRAVFPHTHAAGRVVYEVWPNGGTGTLSLWYFKRTDALTDDTEFAGVLATHTTALYEGALARAARWPGTEQRKNPYFNLALATAHEVRYEQLRNDLDVQDDDQYLQNLQTVDVSRLLGADPATLRQTDATLSDYFGGW